MAASQLLMCRLWDEYLHSSSLHLHFASTTNAHGSFPPLPRSAVTGLQLYDRDDRRHGCAGRCASSSVTAVVEGGADPSLQLHGTETRSWRKALCGLRVAEFAGARPVPLLSTSLHRQALPDAGGWHLTAEALQCDCFEHACLVWWHPSVAMVPSDCDSWVTFCEVLIESARASLTFASRRSSS